MYSFIDFEQNGIKIKVEQESGMQSVLKIVFSSSSFGQMDLNQSIDCNNIIKIDEEEMKLRLSSETENNKKQMDFFFISAKLTTGLFQNTETNLGFKE